MDAKEARGKALRILADAEQRRSEELEREAAPHIAEQKAALRQRLADWGRGSGAWGWVNQGNALAIGTRPMRRQCKRIMDAMNNQWRTRFTLGQMAGHTLDTLTKKLWQMGVRA